MPSQSWKRQSICGKNMMLAVDDRRDHHPEYYASVFIVEDLYSHFIANNVKKEQHSSC